MNLCKETIKIDTRDLLYSEERYVEYFLQLFEKYRFLEYLDINKTKVKIIGKVDNVEFIFNRFAYYLECDNSIVRRSFFVALRNQFDYRTFFAIEERRDFYDYLKLFEIEFKIISRRSNNQENYPDFILDGKTGVEVVHYKDPIAGQFYKYLYPHKKEYMICEDLVKHMGVNAKILFERIRPTIYDGKIFAWSEPLSNVYTVDYTYKMALSRIKGKLVKYNNLHYVKFKKNVLLSRIYFDLNEDNLHKLSSIIISEYPYIVCTYELQIVFLSDYAITKLDLLTGDFVIRKH